MKTFLSPLLRGNPGRYAIENTRTGALVADDLITAFDSAARNRGLLGRESLAAGSAMIIAPCTAVHTFFMRFPIDVAFVTKSGRVVKIRSTVRPWRMSGALGAFAVIELAAGSLARSETQRGDVLALRAVDPADPALPPS